jgi:hypothetical protein
MPVPWQPNALVMCNVPMHTVYGNLISNMGMLVTGTCYYSGNQVFGGVTKQDMLQLATLWCFNFVFLKIVIFLCVFFLVWKTKKCTSHVHVLLYSVKFNGEIDIIQFIFTGCVVYSFSEYFFLLLFQLQKISMTASMKKITWFVIYLTRNQALRAWF